MDRRFCRRYARLPPTGLPELRSVGNVKIMGERCASIAKTAPPLALETQARLPSRDQSTARDITSTWRRTAARFFPSITETESLVSVVM